MFLQHEKVDNIWHIVVSACKPEQIHNQWVTIMTQNTQTCRLRHYLNYWGKIAVSLSHLQYFDRAKWNEGSALATPRRVGENPGEEKSFLTQTHDDQEDRVILSEFCSGVAVPQCSG